MARQDLTQLYSNLMDSRFEFVGHGEFPLATFYTVIKDRYPDLCDDGYLCSVNCQSGHNQPEWRHVVRTALTDLKKRGQGVTSGNRRKFWVIGVAEPAAGVEAIEEFAEGRELRALHRTKERNPKAVRRKKQQVLALHGQLLCEACDFDFEAAYGVLGQGFAECHHRVPLAELAEGHKTRLGKLAIVCSNCHRMLHRSRPMLRVEQLRELVQAQRAESQDAQGTSNLPGAPNGG